MLKKVKRYARPSIPKITCNQSTVRLNKDSTDMVLDKFGVIPQYIELFVDEEEHFLAVKFLNKPSSQSRKIFTMYDSKNKQEIKAALININKENYDWITKTVGKKMLASFKTIEGIDYLVGTPVSQINQRKEAK